MLALLGAAAVTFAASVNSSLQLAVAPEMRGRVMALYSVVFLGSTPIGGPLAGWLSEAYDPRAALLLAASAGLSAAWAARVASPGRRPGSRCRPRPAALGPAGVRPGPASVPDLDSPQRGPARTPGRGKTRRPGGSSLRVIRPTKR